MRRHLHAYLLGEFFRSLYNTTDRKGAMDAFGNMGQFCGKPNVPYWKDKKDPPTLGEVQPSLETRFLKRLFELRDYGDSDVQSAVARLFQKSGLAKAVDNWVQLIQASIENFQRSIQDWNDDYQGLLNFTAQD